MSGPPDLAELLGDGTQTVLLTQASTATEARPSRGRGGPARGEGRGGGRRGGAGAGRRPRRAASLPARDPYHPTERQQRRIMAREPGRAAVLVGEPATVGALRRQWAETTGGADPAGFRG